jgi:hypothetical protein
VPEMRPEFRDSGANRAAAGLARALRSNMARAGWHKIDAYQDDDFAEAESQYRKDTEQEMPVHGTVKFRIGDKWYLYDLARPHLRRALELHKPKGQRSLSAQYLAALLQADEFHREHLAEATPALLEILEEITPYN